MDIIALMVTLVGGILVLVSYIIVFGRLTPGNYFTHPFWYDIKADVIKVLLVFQSLAAIGFLTAISSWIINPPSNGLMGRSGALSSTLGVFLATAALWPWMVHMNYPALTVGSLLGTAAASIALLAGAIEEDNPKWWIVWGTLQLSACTVLGDGVMWNAKYIKSKLQNKSLAVLNVKQV